jgi:hypothetical protein
VRKIPKKVWFPPQKLGAGDPAAEKLSRLMTCIGGHTKSQKGLAPSSTSSSSRSRREIHKGPKASFSVDWFEKRPKTPGTRVQTDTSTTATAQKDTKKFDPNLWAGDFEELGEITIDDEPADRGLGTYKFETVGGFDGFPVEMVGSVDAYLTWPNHFPHHVSSTSWIFGGAPDSIDLTQG